MNRKGIVLKALGLCVAAQILAFQQSSFAEVKGPMLPAYECHRASGPVTIDGKLDEADWQSVPGVNFYLPVTGAKPISNTEGKVLWDDKCLYVAFKASDKDIWSYMTDRDSQTCLEDVLEIFFKTDPTKEPYCNFEINALGTVYDAYTIKKADGCMDGRWKRWNCKGLKVGISINGTLNNPNDIDDYWIMEVAIPFSSLPSLGGKIPNVGDKWMFQLARYDYSVYLSNGMQFFASVPLSKPDFHMPNEWQTLQFAQ